MMHIHVYTRVASFHLLLEPVATVMRLHHAACLPVHASSFIHTGTPHLMYRGLKRYVMTHGRWRRRKLSHWVKMNLARRFEINREREKTSVMDMEVVRNASFCWCLMSGGRCWCKVSRSSSADWKDLLPPPHSRALSSAASWCFSKLVRSKVNSRKTDVKRVIHVYEIDGSKWESFMWSCRLFFILLVSWQ